MPEPYILIVDDEPQIHQLVTLCLRTLPNEVRSASNGPEALKMIEDEKPALLLLDLMMPGMTGEDVLAEMNNDITMQDIPVIVFSAIAKLRFKDTDDLPPQVVDVMDKADMRPSVLRDVVAGHLQ